jgi:hypothetical protein
MIGLVDIQPTARNNYRCKHESEIQYDGLFFDCVGVFDTTNDEFEEFDISIGDQILNYVLSASVLSDIETVVQRKVIKQFADTKCDEGINSFFQRMKSSGLISA